MYNSIKELDIEVNTNLYIYLYLNSIVFSKLGGEKRGWLVLVICPELFEPNDMVENLGNR